MEWLVPIQTFAQNNNRRRFLLTIIVVVAWLYPVLFWSIAGTSNIPHKGQIVLDQPTDSYYSIADHHCYTLVHTDTLPVSHTLESLPITLELQPPGQKPNTVALDVRAGEMETVQLEQSGKQTLVAQSDTGVRASRHIFYQVDVPTTKWLTRTLIVSLSHQAALVTYMAEAALPPPSDLEALVAGEIERELFIKHVFYPSVLTDTELMSCVLFPTAATQPETFTGSELSIVYPPDVSMTNNIAQVTLKANVTGWRYNKYTVQRLVGILPSTVDTDSSVTLFHNGTVVAQPLPQSEALASGYKLTWKNPSTRIKLEYDFNPPTVVTADVRFIPKVLVKRLFSGLSKLDAIHYFVSVLFTLIAPLFLLVGFRRLRKHALKSAWPQLTKPLYLSGLMWIGPLGGAAIALFCGLFFERIPAIFSDINSQTELAQATLIVRNSLLPYAHTALWVAVWCSGIAVLSLSLLRILPKWYKKLWPLLITINLAVLPMIFLINPGRFCHHTLILPLEGGLLATVSATLIYMLTVDNKYHLTIPRIAWIVGIVLLTLLSIPLFDTMYLFDPVIGWSVEDGYRLFLLWGICIIPYLQLLIGLIALKKLDTVDDQTRLQLIRLIFTFLVGFTGVFPQVLPGESASYIPYLFSPVPFVLAWISFRFIVRPALSKQVRAYVLGKRKELLSYALESSGEIRDLVLAVGPNMKNWQNGCLVARYGLILGGALTVLYSIGLLPNIANRLSTPFLPMVVFSVFILPIFLRWVLASFFLGYFFPHLPGRSGAVKGFALACAVATSVFVYDLIFRVRSFGDLQVLFTLDVILTILGLMGIGVLLDYRLFRRADYKWQQLLTLYRIPYLAGYISTLLATVSSTVIGVINGQVSNWAADLVDIILRTGGR